MGVKSIRGWRHGSFGCCTQGKKLIGCHQKEVKLVHLQTRTTDLSNSVIFLVLNYFADIAIILKAPGLEKEKKKLK